jgi:hypothetical protein
MDFFKSNLWILYVLTSKTINTMDDMHFRLERVLKCNGWDNGRSVNYVLEAFLGEDYRTMMFRMNCKEVAFIDETGKAVSHMDQNSTGILFKMLMNLMVEKLEPFTRLDRTVKCLDNSGIEQTIRVYDEGIITRFDVNGELQAFDDCLPNVGFFKAPEERISTTVLFQMLSTLIKESSN